MASMAHRNKRSTFHVLYGLAVPILALTGGCSGAAEDRRNDPVDAEDEGQTELSLGLSIENRRIPINEPVVLTANVNDLEIQQVRLAIDGREVSVCDAANQDDNCRIGHLWRFTAEIAEKGVHEVTASYMGPSGEVKVTQTVEAVESLPPEPELSEVDESGGVTDDTEETALPFAAAAGRGYLDPDKALHNIFGGVKWSVKGQKVNVASPPATAKTAAKNCMAKYGASIRKWGDKYKISRGSIVATAITESNCTNPKGSSDGLSSGPMQVTGSTCASITKLSSATCKARMHSNPDFSFEVGVRYMASSYQRNQHKNDPPKISAAYNAGSLRKSTRNRWHMVVTGNHIERFVGAYNGYRAWEGAAAATGGIAPMAEGEEQVLESFFEGEHVSNVNELPATDRDGQVYFVGDWRTRDGFYFEFRNGKWTMQQ